MEKNQNAKVGRATNVNVKVIKADTLEEALEQISQSIKQDLGAKKRVISEETKQAIDNAIKINPNPHMIAGMLFGKIVNDAINGALTKEEPKAEAPTKEEPKAEERKEVVKTHLTTKDISDRLNSLVNITFSKKTLIAFLGEVFEADTISITHHNCDCPYYHMLVEFTFADKDVRLDVAYLKLKQADEDGENKYVTSIDFEINDL